LDAVRRKTVLRCDETEPARARPCVGRSSAAFERSEHGVAVTALAAAELLGSHRFESAVSCASSHQLARVPEEAVDLGVAARKRTRRAG
jgi:hypothetical protein